MTIINVIPTFSDTSFPNQQTRKNCRNADVVENIVEKY